MVALLTEIVHILVGAVSTLGEGIATGINDTVTALFMGAEPNTLSVFGGMIAVFGGIALAVGLSRKIFSFVATLGARK